jgi:HK97 gp10 family phage protein
MKLIGVESMDRKLIAIREAVSPEARERSLLIGASIVADEARRLVPVLTGNLRDSIIVTFDRGGVAGGDISGQRFSSTVYVGPSAHRGFYGFLVEFGTSNMAAHPFMRPALDNRRDEVQRAIGHSLWADIKKAA